MSGDLFGNTVATAQDAPGGLRCAWCGTWVTLDQPDPQRRFCDDSCRSKAWEKGHPRVPAENRGKQTRAEKILARLRQGPATGLELLQAGGGTRYGARILELRERGHRVHGPFEMCIPGATAAAPWVWLEAIPKTDDGHELYELREPVGKVEE